MSLSKIKKYVKNRYPTLLDNFKRISWALKLHTSFFEPEIFSDLRHLSAAGPTEPMPQSQRKKKILFFAVRQDFVHIAWEHLIARALQLRGHEIEYVACDGHIRKYCNERWYPELKIHDCNRCKKYAEKFYEAADFNVHWVSGFSTGEIRKNAESFIDAFSFHEYRNIVYDGFPVGDYVRPSVCHFCRVEDIEHYGESDPIVRRIYRDFLTGAVEMVHICKNILNHFKPETVVMINGQYASERVMLESAKRSGLHVVSMETGIPPDSLFLLHDEFIVYQKVEGWEQKKNIKLSQSQNETLDKYLEERGTGQGQITNYFTGLGNTRNNIFEELGLDKNKKNVVLFPNVTWDSALYGLEIVFKTLKEWVEATIAIASAHKAMNLVIRCHPADATWPGAMRDSVFAWVNENFNGTLPKNVRVISPMSEVDSYALMDQCDFGLVFSSTTGLELALKGKPVILVGKAPYWGKGFTLDPKTPDEYVELIGSLCRNDSGFKKYAPNMELVRRYAYFMCFEASIKLKHIDTAGYRRIPRYKINSYDELREGMDSFLDAICKGVTDRSPFVVGDTAEAQKQFMPSGKRAFLDHC